MPPRETHWWPWCTLGDYTLSLGTLGGGACLHLSREGILLAKVAEKALILERP